jgi:acyl-CoA synthetase (AMP-forming)/AMP-acid ligase II
MGLPSAERAHLQQYDPIISTAFKDADDNADTVMFKQHQGADRLRCATNFMGVRTTYARLDTEIETVARCLLGFGVRQGDYVSISLPNLKETVLYIYGCWRIGAVCNLIDPRTNGEGIAERVKRTASKLLVTVLNVIEPKIDEVLGQLPPVVVVAPCDGVEPFVKLKPTLGIYVYNKKKEKFRAARQEQFASGDYIFHTDFLKQYGYNGKIETTYYHEMPAAVLYTSGTTADGIIKGAVHTHYSLNAAPGAFQYCVRTQEYQKGFTFGGFVPFFSAYGLVAGLHSTLCGGLEILLVPIFDPNKFDKLILSLKPNIFYGVPRFFEALANSPKLKKKNNRLHFIKIAISGGDRISPTALEHVNAAFARSGFRGGLRVGYGATEFGGSVTVMPHYDPASEDFDWRGDGNVGQLIPGTRAMVVDPETMRELDFDQDGELLMQSESMMQSYFGMPEKTEELLYRTPGGDVYCRTGDKGHLSRNGCFYFVDRYKRSIMRPDGHTVHPSPIENVIMSHPAVDICAVVGLKQSGRATGAVPSAFVVFKNKKMDADEKRETLRQIDALSLKKLPERDRAIAYTATEELPYTLMGKIHYRELEQKVFAEEEFVITDTMFFPAKKKHDK